MAAGPHSTPALQHLPTFTHPSLQVLVFDLLLIFVVIFFFVILVVILIVLVFVFVFVLEVIFVGVFIAAFGSGRLVARAGCDIVVRCDVEPDCGYAECMCDVVEQSGIGTGCDDVIRNDDVQVYE